MTVSIVVRGVVGSREGFCFGLVFGFGEGKNCIFL